ncbi:PTS sugar transporter subunit IIB [Bacillus sp. N9]
MSKEKVNLLFVCGFGVGSSLMMKMSVEPVLEKYGINCDMQVTAAGEANGYLDWADIVGVNEMLGDVLNIPDNKEIEFISVKNLTDGEAISKQVLEIVKEKFPAALIEK